VASEARKSEQRVDSPDGKFTSWLGKQ
jgi:hypothetical protein